MSTNTPARERQLLALCAAADVRADSPVRVVNGDMVYGE
jgi:hypothetical protein